MYFVLGDASFRCDNFKFNFSENIEKRQKKIYGTAFRLTAYLLRRLQAFTQRQ